MKISHLSDEKLLNSINTLVAEERVVLSQVLLHLQEIDARKLYSDLKYASLYEYCVKGLKYSEAQASRRVGACRLLREVPDILPHIISGDLNLTQLSLANSMFNDEDAKCSEEKLKILNEISGKSKKETEKILDQKRKNPKTRRSSIFLKNETIELLKEVQDLKAHTFKDIDEVIIEMVKLAKKEWEPRGAARQKSPTEGNSRYISVQVKEVVRNRDKNKCTNCGSKHALEFDHIIPYANGGKSTVKNLRLLCRNCNQRKGLVDFPNGFNRKFR